MDIEYCRLCLAGTLDSYSLLNNELANKLEALTAIKITAEDMYSTISCFKCTVDVETAFQIQQKILKADENLQKDLMNKMKIKVETIDNGEEDLLDNVSENLIEKEMPIFERIEDDSQDSGFVLKTDQYDVEIKEEMLEDFPDIVSEPLSCKTELIDFDESTLSANEFAETPENTFLEKDFGVQNNIVESIKANSEVDLSCYICYNCGIEFDEKALYNLHMKMHSLIGRNSTDRSHEIVKRSSETKKRDELNVEFDTNLPPNVKHCSLCTKAFQIEELSDEHSYAKKACPTCQLKVWRSPCQNASTYKCELCGIIRRSLKGLNMHKIEVHTGLKYVCGICGVEVQKIQDLTVHHTKFHDAPYGLNKEPEKQEYIANKKVPSGQEEKSNSESYLVFNKSKLKFKKISTEVGDSGTPENIADNSQHQSEPKSISIPCSKKHGNGKVRRNKYHACFSCGKLVIQIRNHLMRMHPLEEKIKKIRSMPISSKESKQAYIDIIKFGDYYHNGSVLSNQKGELILLRRPTLIERKRYNIKDYGPCPRCLGFMMKGFIIRHLKYNCEEGEKLRQKGEGFRKKYIMQEVNALLFSFLMNAELVDDFERSLIDNLKNNDRVDNYCRDDSLILKFGMMEFQYNRSDKIYESMRQLARFTLKVHEQINCKLLLGNFLFEEKFDLLVVAFKSLYETMPQSTNRYNFAMEIGLALRKCSALQRAFDLKEGNLKQNKALMNFINVLDLKWKSATCEINLITPIIDLSTSNSNKCDMIDASSTNSDVIPSPKHNSTKIRESENVLNKRNMRSRKTIQNIKRFSNPTEKQIVLQYFDKYIKMGVVPKKRDIEKITNLNNILPRRSWIDIKLCITKHLTSLKLK